MMMKIAVLMFVALELALAARTPCSSDADCQSDQCCVSSIFAGQGRRRRFLLDDIFTHHHGFCLSLAQEGSTCEPDMDIFGGSKTHSLGCPCAQGLECHGEKESHHGGSHSYVNPKCMPAGTYTGNPTSQTVTDSGVSGQPLGSSNAP